MEKSRENRQLLMEKSRENRQLLMEKSRENRQLLMEKSRENRQLLMEKSRENRQLLMEKSRENKQLLMEKSRESRQLTPKLEDNIKMDVKGTGFEDADCSRVAQDRNTWQGLVNTVISLPESTKCAENSRKCKIND
jgi:hypothetical protein